MTLSSVIVVAVCMQRPFPFAALPADAKEAAAFGRSAFFYQDYNELMRAFEGLYCNSPLATRALACLMFIVVLQIFFCIGSSHASVHVVCRCNSGGAR